MFFGQKLGKFLIPLFLSTSLLASFYSPTTYAKDELKNVTLSIYIDPVGAPHAFIEDNLMVMKGLDVDIIYELKKRLGFNFKDNRLYPMARNDAFNQLKTGHADLVAGGISWTSERAQSYDFTPIFFSSSLAVMYNKDGAVINQIKDIKGKRIGIQKGSTSENYVSAFGGVAVPFDNLTFGMFAVGDKEIDGFLYDKPPLADFARSLTKLNLDISKEPFGEEACQFSFALAKDAPHNEILSKAIEEMIQDGTIDALLKKWEAD